MAMTAVPYSRYVAFFSIAAGGCAVDLATKRYVFSWLGMPHRCEPTWLWTNVIGFQTSLNEGALFGMGQGMVPVFAILSVGAALGILWWLFRGGAACQWALTVALGCIMGGVLGNLYDRVGLPGLIWNYAGPLHQEGGPVYAVRDWIQVMIGTWPWPTFNIADSLLVCGAALLIWHAYWAKPEEEKKPEEEVPSP
jgi:signal peptidase II